MIHWVHGHQYDVQEDAVLLTRLMHPVDQASDTGYDGGLLLNGTLIRDLGETTPSVQRSVVRAHNCAQLDVYAALSRIRSTQVRCACVALFLACWVRLNSL